MRALAVLAGLTLLATPLMAQNPDFSGTWKVDTDKSDAPQGRGGGMMGMGELKITQEGGKLTLVMSMGERSRTTTYNLDGSESRNPGMRGNEMVTKSHWEGKTLVTEGENTFNTPNGDMTVKTREERSLSDDGKTMTVTTNSTTPQGERTRKMVYDKQ
jgi:hypothetical protein